MRTGQVNRHMQVRCFSCPTVTQPTVAAGVAEETCVAQQCKNACSPDGNYQGSGPKTGCTATYCDYYKPDGQFYSRCKTGAEGHNFALEECQLTCGICSQQLKSSVKSFVATQIVYDPDAGDGTHGNDGVEDSWSASLLGVPNTAYTVSYEILNSDLDLDDEKLVRVVVGGVSMPGCGGAGDNRPDYQCDFTECNSSSQTVTADSSGNIAVVATYTNNSKDCDCDQSDSNGNCVKEDTGSAEWTPTKAALKFTLTQA